MTLGKSNIALVPFLGANHCIFSHEKKFAIKPQYFRIRRQKKGACIKYAHANKKHYSSIVDAAVQHDILHNQIKENIVIISNWKGTFIKCKTCKHILTGKKDGLVKSNDGLYACSIIFIY